MNKLYHHLLQPYCPGEQTLSPSAAALLPRWTNSITICCSLTAQVNKLYHHLLQPYCPGKQTLSPSAAALLPRWTNSVTICCSLTAQVNKLYYHLLQPYCPGKQTITICCSLTAQVNKLYHHLLQPYCPGEQTLSPSAAALLPRWTNSITICCSLTAQVNKLYHILQLPPVDWDWIVGGGILAQDVYPLVIDHETCGTGCLAKFVGLLLYVLMSMWWSLKVICIVQVL